MHQMKIPALLAVLSLAVATTTFAGEKSTDIKGIQGTWLPVKAELRGVVMKDEALKKIEWLKLNDGNYEVKAESLDKGTYEINSGAKPKTIDVTGTEGPNLGRKMPAIYELNGDTLVICYGLGGSPRPTEFKSAPGTKNFLVTYKRKKV